MSRLDLEPRPQPVRLWRVVAEVWGWGDELARVAMVAAAQRGRRDLLGGRVWAVFDAVERGEFGLAWERLPGEGSQAFIPPGHAWVFGAPEAVAALGERLRREFAMGGEL